MKVISCCLLLVTILISYVQSVQLASFNTDDIVIFRNLDTTTANFGKYLSVQAAGPPNSYILAYIASSADINAQWKVTKISEGIFYFHSLLVTSLGNSNLGYGTQYSAFLFTDGAEDSENLHWEVSKLCNGQYVFKNMFFQAQNPFLTGNITPPLLFSLVLSDDFDIDTGFAVWDIQVVG